MTIRRCMLAGILCAAVVAAPLWPASATSKSASSPAAPLKLQLPDKQFEGTPRTITIPIRPKIEQRRILVPAGRKLTNLAKGKPVSSSDEEPILGELEYVTDGDKEGVDGSFVELGPGVQWVQIDLGKPRDVYAVVLWHYHRTARVYKDVVVQAADDKDFILNVRTLFNNDHDNSAGLGIGKDWHFVDEFPGEVVFPARHEKGVYRATRPVRARYLRLYSNGNTSNDLNHYTEVEVWGTPGN